MCDIIDNLEDLRDSDICNLRFSSSQSTYTSVTSVDEFSKCISNHLEGELLPRIILAHAYSLLAYETTRYVDFWYSVKEEYLGLVEVLGSKGSEAPSRRIYMRCAINKRNRNK